MDTVEDSQADGRKGLQKQYFRILGGPLEYVAYRNGNLSQLDLQRNHHLPGVFNLTQEFAPFVGPQRHETLAEVPKRDSHSSAKDCREAGVQQLTSDSQPVSVRQQLNEEIKFERLCSIQQVPLRVRPRTRTECRCGKAVEQKLNPGLRL